MQFNRRKFISLSAMTAASLPLSGHLSAAPNQTNTITGGFMDKIVPILLFMPMATPHLCLEF